MLPGICVYLFFLEVLYDYPACIHHVYHPETVAYVAQLIELSSISRTNAYAPIAQHKLLFGHGISYTLELLFDFITQHAPSRAMGIG